MLKAAKKSPERKCSACVVGETKSLRLCICLQQIYVKICVKTPSKQILEFRKVGFEVSLCHRDGRKCVGKFQGFGLVSGKSSK